MKEQVSPLEHHPLIAILRGLTAKDAIAVGDAIIEQGFTALEVPLQTDSSLEAIEVLSQAYRDDALIGAGTVLKASQVKRAAEVGARFIVSPNTNPTVIESTKEAQLYSVPGCQTATEAFQAIEHGADALKFFPANAVTPATLKACATVIPKHIPMFMVGGINAENMIDYWTAGAKGFGMGESLYTPDRSIAEIKQRAASMVSALKKAMRNA